MSETYWQHEYLEWNQRVSHLLQSGECCDCTFLLGSEPNRTRLDAHKVILSAASPVFMAMFFGSMAEKDGPIEIVDLQPEDFETILQYIYTKNASLDSVEKAFSVYYGAKKYMLEALEKECILFISLNINPQNICRVYGFAQFNDETHLFDQCVQMLTNNTKEVVHNWNLEEGDIGILLTLVSYESLNIDSELDLFQAIENYFNIHSARRLNMESYDFFAKKANVRESLAVMLDVPRASNEAGPSNSGINNTGVTQSTPEKPLNQNQDQDKEKCTCKSIEADISSLFDTSNNRGTLLGYLRDAVCKIRFLTLTAQQFADGPALSPLLAESEAFAVFMNITSRHGAVEMPKGFSLSRVPRNQKFLPLPICRNEVIFRFTVLHVLVRKRAVESQPFPFMDMFWSIKMTPRFETTTAGQVNRYFALILKCAGPGSASRPELCTWLGLDVGLRAAPGPGPGSTSEQAARSASARRAWLASRSAGRSASRAAAGSASGSEAGPSNEPDSWSVAVRARILLVPCVPTETTVCIDQAGIFSNDRRIWGYNRFVSWDVAMSAIYLQPGNSITLEVYLGELEKTPTE